jgi:hypothetical protein
LQKPHHPGHIDLGKTEAHEAAVPAGASKTYAVAEGDTEAVPDPGSDRTTESDADAEDDSDAANAAHVADAGAHRLSVWYRQAEPRGGGAGGAVSSAAVR